MTDKGWTHRWSQSMGGILAYHHSMSVCPSCCRIKSRQASTFALDRVCQESGALLNFCAASLQAVTLEPLVDLLQGHVEQAKADLFNIPLHFGQELADLAKHESANVKPPILYCIICCMKSLLLLVLPSFWQK